MTDRTRPPEHGAPPPRGQAPGRALRKDPRFSR